MNRRANQNKKILKTFKDYLVPIFFVFIILIFIVHSLFSGDEKIVVDSGDNSFLSLSLSSPQTEAYIEYNGWNKTKLEWEVSLYKSEKLQVVSESVKLSEENASFHLNRLWELRYNEDKSYTLYSSDLWADVKKDVRIEMRYAKVQASSGSVFALSQNEVASTVYVLSGTVEIQNLVGKSTILQKGEKMVIMRNNASDKNSDLALTKESIDEYTKGEEWFVKNNGNYYLSQSDTSAQTLSGTTTSSGQHISQWEYITFNRVFDEAEVNTDKIDLEGTIIDERVATINIQGKNAEINIQNKTFAIKELATSARVNDIVYKIYDSSSQLLYKWILTLHNSKWSQSGTTGGTASSGLAWVQNYPISTSPLYQIISPKQNPYTTTENVVRIEGTVPARTITKIFINDFQLQKFVPNSTYWQYFANSEFGNLKSGINIYKIQFYSGENIVYEMNYTIIKEEEKIIKEEESQSVQ
jgi:hypothetical protein